MTSRTANRVSWMSTTSVDPKSRDVATIAADVADAVAALDLDPGAGVRAYLDNILRRADERGVGAVPVSVAAKLLAVSQPTVRSWIDRGVLERAATAGPMKVTAASLGRTLASVRTLRSAGKTRGLLTEAIQQLDDRDTRTRLAGRIERLREGKTVKVDLDNLDSLFE